MKSFATITTFLLSGQVALAEFGRLDTRAMKRRSLSDVGSLDAAGSALDSNMSLELTVDAKAGKMAKSKAQKGEASYEQGFSYSLAEGTDAAMSFIYLAEGTYTTMSYPLAKGSGSPHVASTASKAAKIFKSKGAPKKKGSEKSKVAPKKKGSEKSKGAPKTKGSEKSKGGTKVQKATILKNVRSSLKPPSENAEASQEQTLASANAESGASGLGAQGAFILATVFVIGAALLAA